MEQQMLASMEEVEGRHWWFRARREILLEKLADTFPASGRRLLDIGCGTGTNLAAMAAVLPGVELTGLDADPFCREACGRKGLSVGDGDIRELDFPDGSFDAVTAFDVLEHIDDEHRALAELYRVLAPGGVLLLTVPAYDWLWSQHDDRAHHQRRYVSRRLRLALESAGFRVEYATYFNTLLFPVAVAVRLLERATGAVADGQKLLPAPLEGLFYRTFRLERAFTGRGRTLPWGLSLMAVGRRED